MLLALDVFLSFPEQHMCRNRSHSCLLWHASEAADVIEGVCRLREAHTLKGHVESVVRLKGLDINTIQQSYTV